MAFTISLRRIFSLLRVWIKKYREYVSDARKLKLPDPRICFIARALNDTFQVEKTFAFIKGLNKNK